MRALRCGVNLSTSTTDDPVRFARRAEALGFDFVSSSDHPCGGPPNLMTSDVDATDQLERLGQEVLPELRQRYAT